MSAVLPHMSFSPGVAAPEQLSEYWNFMSLVLCPNIAASRVMQFGGKPNQNQNLGSAVFLAYLTMNILKNRIIQTVCHVFS